MTRTQNFQSLSDDELLRRLSVLLSQSRRVEAELVAHIGEVDERRLYALHACSSMFMFCTEVLHLSEGEAYLRIAVARTARRHPALLSMLGDGRLHLSGITVLAPHLTEENCATVLAQAVHKSKAQIRELVAGLAPKPDVPATIRKLPTPTPRPTPPEHPVQAVQLSPDRVVPPAPAPIPAPSVPPAPAKTEPLSPERYKVSFTASKKLRDKLERLQALMDVDMAAAIEAAVTERLERLEAKRYGATKRPRKSLEETDTSPKSRYIPAAARRVVRERDSGQCQFVDDTGRRCPERRWLEFHHDDPYARGGEHDPARIRLMCRAHNRYLAEQDYGKEVMKRYRRNPDRVSELAPVYGFIGPRIVRSHLAVSEMEQITDLRIFRTELRPDIRLLECDLWLRFLEGSQIEASQKWPRWKLRLRPSLTSSSGIPVSTSSKKFSRRANKKTTPGSSSSLCALDFSFSL